MAGSELSTAQVSDAIKSNLKSQYHAALAMLGQSIERCPEDLWVDSVPTNAFWRIAYHGLHYAHLYIQTSAEAFRPWEHHQTDVQYLDDLPAPPDIADLVELPHRPPQTGVPYTKTQILSYWTLCDQMVDNAIDAMDVFSPVSGFSWYKISKLEHQLVSLRHIQHHAAQLADRVRAATGEGIEWVGARRR